MTRWTAVIVGGVLGAGIFFSASAGGDSSCVARCTIQYDANLKNCKTTLAKNGRRDWYGDCVKHAENFRQECVLRCR